MSKFNVGDQVRRTTIGYRGVHVGGVYTIDTITDASYLTVKGSGGTFTENYFELVAPADLYEAANDLSNQGDDAYTESRDAYRMAGKLSALLG